MLVVKNKNFQSDAYYSNSYIMSLFPKYKYFVTIGSRGRGKTYSAKKYVIKRFKKGHIKKFAWLRLTDSAVEKIIESNGATFFERTLLEKYKINIQIENSDIYFSKDEDFTTDKEGNKKYNYTHVGKVMSLQSYFKYKGNQFEDYDLIIMDELVRETTERRTFEIVSAFINQIENICRFRKDIRVLIYCNAINEMQEISGLFGFVPFPGKFGVYKIPNKKAVIEYLQDSVEWKKKRADTMAGLLISEKDTSFSNKHINDTTDIILDRRVIPKRTHLFRIKIDKYVELDLLTSNEIVFVDNASFYTGNVINRYVLNQSMATPVHKYSTELIKILKEWWNIGKYRFSSQFTFLDFKNSLIDNNIIKS